MVRGLKVPVCFCHTIGYWQIQASGGIAALKINGNN